MIVILMGVSGVGKTTIGKLFADRFNWQFIDADEFHSPENIEKMRQGISLNDTDRMPWLEALQIALNACLLKNQNAVVACSALKTEYRKILTVDVKQVKFVYLQANPELIAERLKTRQNHFMSAQLLQSQLDSLEEPDNAIKIDVSSTPPTMVVEEIWQKLVTLT